MGKALDKVHWLAVDWGTSNLRVWAMDAQGQVLDHVCSDQGMAVLERDGFEPALLAVAGPFLSDERVTPVICCGMVGSRQGWVEAGYHSAPCQPPAGHTAAAAPVTDPRIDVYVLPGVKQPSPPDVMRGEETQIAGFLHRHPNFDGVLCMPGTHTKWVQISAGEIVSFRTCMTGELFALLSDHSVLRHSVATPDLDRDAFVSAVSDAIARPQALSADLFRIRAATLISDLSADQARARLSGTLIGAELAATRPYWLGQGIAIVGAQALAELYQTALSEQGAQADLADVTQMTLLGLTAAHATLKDPAT